MTKAYEYHKQNDYPGERVAERKRVDDRAEAAGKRCDARVAEKGRTDELRADNRVARRGRMDDQLMDDEIQRSTAKAQRVNSARNSADTVMLIVVAGVLVILLFGLGWSLNATRQQSNEIDSLRAQLAAEPACNPQTAVQLDSTNKQIQLYNDFLLLTSNVKKEVRDLGDFNASYSTMYHMCADYAGRTNEINLALSRFAEKEIIYYRQIAVLAEKPQCKAKIETLNLIMASSKAADANYYTQYMNQCNKLINTQAGASIKYVFDLEVSDDLKSALADSDAKAAAFTSAENDVIKCFA